MSLPTRRIKVQASGGSAPIAFGVGVPPPAQASSPRSIEDRRAETGRVIRRLEAVVATHLESARRMGEPLTAARVVAVLDALRAEAGGTEPAAAFVGNEVAVYIQQTLYEELLEEPSNIFYSTRVSAEVMRYEPLPRGFWLACLDTLQARLPKLGVHIEAAE